MIYLISALPTGYYSESKIHEIVSDMDGVTDWWYFTNVHLIETNKTPLQMTTEIRKYLPNLQHFITKVDLNQTAGILPKEAWDWVNSKYPSMSNMLKIKPIPKSLGMFPPIQPSAINEFLKGK